MGSKVTKDVKSKGEVVGQVEIDVFDNYDEAEALLGEEKCVALINKGHSIEKQDEVRRQHTGTTSTGIRDLMGKLKENPEALAELMAKFGIESNLV